MRFSTRILLLPCSPSISHGKDLGLISDMMRPDVSRHSFAKKSWGTSPWGSTPWGSTCKKIQSKAPNRKPTAILLEGKMKESSELNCKLTEKVLSVSFFLFFFYFFSSFRLGRGWVKEFWIVLIVWSALPRSPPVVFLFESRPTYAVGKKCWLSSDTQSSQWTSGRPGKRLIKTKKKQRERNLYINPWKQ